MHLKFFSRAAKEKGKEINFGGSCHDHPENTPSIQFRILIHICLITFLLQNLFDRNVGIKWQCFFN
mgnify:CR=1 FL=1